MKRLDPSVYATFQGRVGETSAYFRPDRPSTIVSKADDPQDPEIFSGLMVNTEGIYRLALDKVNNAVVMLHSKVADNLRGERDPISGEIRPTDKGLRRSYGVSAQRIQPGSSILPPQRAQNFQKTMRAHNTAIRKLSTEYLNIYGMRFDDLTIYGNKHMAYAIQQTGQDRYSVDVVIPRNRSGEGFLPNGVKAGKMPSIMGKKLAKNVSLAEAQSVFATHWQDVTSRIWDADDPYKNEGMKLKKVLADIGIYTQERGIFLTGGFLVAGGFLAVKDPSLGAAIGGLAAAHASLDIAFHESAHGIGKWWERRNDTRDPNDINTYEDGEAIDFYLIRDKANLKRLARHVDVDKCKAEDFRFLTIDEMRHMLPPHMDFEERLHPASLQSLVTDGSRRGFTPKVMFPAPMTQMEIFQSGLVTLKHAMDDGRILSFATYREEACVKDDVRLPCAYIDQLSDQQKPIQRIIYNPRHIGSYGDSFEQQAVSFEQMVEELRDKLFTVDKSSRIYTGEISPRFQAEGFEAIRGYFDPEQDRASSDLYMGGTEPLVPSYRNLA